MMEKLALATILVPFAGAVITLLAPKGAAKWIGQLSSAIASICVLMVALSYHSSGQASVGIDLLSFGSCQIFGLTIDSVSTLIGFAVVFLGFLVCVYSTAYLSDGNREHPHVGRPRYYAFLQIFIGAMAGLVFSSSIVGQLLFFEITGACSWGLIGYYEKPKGLKAAMKALIITHIASIGLYFAAASVFASTGSFALTGIQTLGEGMKTAVLLGVLFAAWGKSAQLPMHMWLPEAMEAPTPVSAYLHAASMVKVGVYIFARGILSAGTVPHVVGTVGVVMALITLLYGFAMYLPQKDMKRLLAYSTITQLSYIFLALSLSIFGSTMAFKGGIAHIFNHAFAKSLFFLVAGAFSYSCGTRLMPQLRGVLSRLPLLGISFCVAALAISGVPPFNGFFSKFMIFSAGFELSRDNVLFLIVMVIAMLESVATFAWFLMWFGRTIPGEPSPEVAAAQPVPFAIKFVLVVLIVMSLCSSFIAAAWLG
jgi:hydrogenase-4 component D